MPYCPECKYEYNPGIKKCPDCDVSLVDELAHEEVTEAHVELVCVASYPYDVMAQEARIMLESYDIKSILQNEIMSQADIILAIAGGGVKVYVSKKDAARAKEILES